MSKTGNAWMDDYMSDEEVNLIFETSEIKINFGFEIENKGLKMLSEDNHLTKAVLFMNKEKYGFDIK